MDDQRRRTDEPDDRAGYVAPVGTVGRSWTSIPLVAIATLAFLVAILKPWSLLDGGPGTSPLASDPGHGPAIDGSEAFKASPVQGTSADAEVTSICHNTDTWLFATVETSRAREVRVLRVLPPSSAAQPGDNAIPPLTFGSETVTELGWCAPVTGSSRSAGVVAVEAWLIVGGVASPLHLDRLRPVDDAASRFAALYAPPAAASVRVVPAPDPAAAGRPGTFDGSGPPRGGARPSAISWASGAYVFRLRTADGVVQTYAVDIEIVPWKLPPRAAPTATPTPPVPPSHATTDMCIGSDSWLVTSEERIAGRAIRTWTAIAPVDTVVGPDDPAIPWVPVTSDSVDGLGWCGPEVGTGSLADPTVVEAWTVNDAGLRTLVLLRLSPTGPPSGLGGLYRPAFAQITPGATAAWPPGRYLFRVRSADGRVFTFGVEVEAVQGR